jgi:uncharacterized protein YjbJ (UPF0337 family)
MTSNRVAGAWYQLKGKVKEQWGKLTGDAHRQIEGHAEQLVGKLQGRYGLPREDAERHGQEFRRRLRCQ